MNHLYEIAEYNWYTGYSANWVSERVSFKYDVVEESGELLLTMRADSCNDAVGNDMKIVDDHPMVLAKIDRKLNLHIYVREVFWSITNAIEMFADELLSLKLEFKHEYKHDKVFIVKSSAVVSELCENKYIKSCWIYESNECGSEVMRIYTTDKAIGTYVIDIYREASGDLERWLPVCERPERLTKMVRKTVW